MLSGAASGKPWLFASKALTLYLTDYTAWILFLCLKSDFWEALETHSYRVQDLKTIRMKLVSNPGPLTPQVTMLYLSGEQSKLNANRISIEQ